MNPRTTEPQDTLLGLLVTYSDIEPHLIEGEARGRDWIHRRATDPDADAYLTDWDILDMHTTAFGHVYAWAGKPRSTRAGPGGNVFVEPGDIRPKLRELKDNFRFWVDAMPDDYDLNDVALLLARTHHAFEYIHPFPDTNGRTGRLLDHFVLWVTLGYVGPTTLDSPQIVHFPDGTAVGDYFAGLHDASNRFDYTRLTAYYHARLTETLLPGT